MNSTKLIELGNAAYKEVSHKTDKRSFLDGFYKGILYLENIPPCETCEGWVNGKMSIQCHACKRSWPDEYKKRV